jgi:hypothetical protein
MVADLVIVLALVFSSVIGYRNGLIRTLFKFGDKSRDYSREFNQDFKSEQDFADFYPFQPYQFELLQASLIELSRHNFFTGKFKSIGERSMLGILQDVVKSLGDEQVGRLATFDAMFEAFMAWQKNTAQPGMNSAAAVTYANAVEAAAAATNAAVPLLLLAECARRRCTAVRHLPASRQQLSRGEVSVK